MIKITKSTMFTWAGGKPLYYVLIRKSFTLFGFTVRWWDTLFIGTKLTAAAAYAANRQRLTNEELIIDL